MWHGNAHCFAIIIVIQVVLVVLFVLIAFIEMKNPRNIAQYSAHGMISYEKSFCCQNYAIFEKNDTCCD